MKKLFLSLCFLGILALPARAESASKFNEKLMTAWVQLARLEYTDAVKTLDAIDNATEKQQKIKAVMLLAVLRNSGNIAVEGRPEDAIALLSRAIKIKDDHAHTRRRRGEAYCMVGMIAECEKDFNEAWGLEVKRDPNAAASHLSQWGAARQKAGDFDGAKEAYKSAAFYYDSIGKKSLAEIYTTLSN